MSKPFYFAKKLFYSIALIILLLSSCTTVPEKEISPLQASVAPIQYTKYESVLESLVYHLVRIELDNPTVSIVATEPFDSNTFETKGETTKEFAKEEETFVAINTSPFSYPATRFSSKRNIEGLYIYEGKHISKPNENYAALCFTKDKRAFIVNSQSIENTHDAYFAFGGFWTILENNSIFQFKDIKDARTAVGISEDGYTIYILTVEKNAKSSGLSFMDCAKILQDAGAHTAIQLDGGDSTSLVFPESSKNSVSSNRKVANNLGFVVAE